VEVYHGLENVPRATVGGCALTIGNFDGLHTGHQRLISEVLQRAELIDGPSLVMTFSPHPGHLLAPKKHPPLLTTDQQKARLIEQAGIEHLVFVNFNEELAEYDPKRFVREIIIDILHPRQIIVGYDFCFGRQRKGNFETLRRMSGEFDYEVDVVGAHSRGDTIVSSSLIRKTIASGEVRAATRYLGRFYSIEGDVIGGKKVGRQLGYPTANIAAANELIPPDGVYAVFSRVGDKIHQGAASIGTRPTFDDVERTIEVFLLDFDGDIYSEHLEIGFVKRIRDQITFPGPDELVGQIKADIVSIKQTLNEFPPENINF
jgi:riboflavin kinase / FMN adenylyltransferase